MTERWLSRVFQRQVLYRINCERRMKNCRPKFIQIHHLLFLQLIFFNWRTPCRWVVRTTHPRPVIKCLWYFLDCGFIKNTDQICWQEPGAGERSLMSASWSVCWTVQCQERLCCCVSRTWVRGSQRSVQALVRALESRIRGFTFTIMTLEYILFIIRLYTALWLLRPRNKKQCPVSVPLLTDQEIWNNKNNGWRIFPLEARGCL